MKEQMFLMVSFFYLLTNPIYAQTQYTWDFEQSETGTLPEKWEPAETRGKGALVSWAISTEDDINNKILAISSNDNSGEMANLMLIKQGAFKNVELSTHIKAGQANAASGGGLIWRVVDENHYYLAQWNPGAENFRLYLYIGGKPSLLESVALHADPKEWHQIAISHNEETIEISFDNESILSFKDNKLDLPGWFGLWAPGSAVPAFDNVNFYSTEIIGEEPTDPEP